ncbi:unnamed protein product [Macrosiphum euphorbiae]|uniref:CCHC-type domain-containing protein n=1 Tax=Macrosiphum euphorbiae TaxID=13131 RepID=A0AAV0Y3R6_9HEMI|nr:unnamed protein product [Macrosiphum euphorbiae]
MTYVEGSTNLPHLRTVIKSRNFETLEDAMKASLEEQKIYQSSKETQRILKLGNQCRNNNQKYCEICNRNNHFTNQCRYGNRGQDTGQQNFQSKVHSNLNNKDVKKITCAYCNKPGHSEDICYKKKKTNKSNGQFSGNGPRPSGSGNQSVKTLKTIALNLQEPCHSKSN